jgi:thiamine-monophosphate kinase
LRKQGPVARGQGPGEIEIVARIRRMKGAEGIGDDCAIFGDLVFSCDQMIEGVHFKREWGAARIGERALARALSDIAAMGARPRFCLVSIAAGSGEWILEFYRGLMRVARKTSTILAGGDLAKSKKVYCDVTVCGSVAKGKALRRDGARAGDSLWVSGRLGKDWNRRIEPRIALGRSLVGRATSCMDLSDGLSMDLARLCAASGVAAEVERVPVARGSTILRALHGGEDYELLFTLAAGKSAPRGCFRIGRMVAGSGVFFEGRELRARGWDHFR